MTPHRGQLSENEKVVLFCLLFPLLWPFLPVILICIVIEKIKFAYWDWKYRKVEQ